MNSNDTVINHYYELLKRAPNESNLKALIAYSRIVANQYHAAEIGKPTEFEVSENAAAIFNAVETLVLYYEKATGDYVPESQRARPEILNVAFQTFSPIVVPGLNIIKGCVERGEFNFESLPEFKQLILNNERLAQELKKSNKGWLYLDSPGFNRDRIILRKNHIILTYLELLAEPMSMEQFRRIVSFGSDINMQLFLHRMGHDHRLDFVGTTQGQSIAFTINRVTGAYGRALKELDSRTTFRGHRVEFKYDDVYREFADLLEMTAKKFRELILANNCDFTKIANVDGIDLSQCPELQEIQNKFGLRVAELRQRNPLWGYIDEGSSNLEIGD